MHKLARFIKIEERFSKVAKLFFVGVFSFVLVYGIFLAPPKEFPSNDMIMLNKGASVSSSADLLRDRKIIRSSFVFRGLVKLFSKNGVVAGGYLFTDKQNLFTVVSRFISGDFELNNVKVTFPEGITVKDAAEICHKALTYCDKDEFIKLASGSEGYLFPDTYFFLQSANAEEVVNTMKETFNQRTGPLGEEIRSYGKSLNDIVTMASILEKEAQNFENRQLVAGILWKRISIGMPLQADATLTYITGRSTYALTMADLATTSPYNTYKYKGLPPAPIANPGIASIKAALSATPTKFLYYLTDRSGKFHFASTYSQHLANKSLYIGN